MSFHQLTIACGNQTGLHVLDVGNTVGLHVLNVGPPGADGVNGGGAYAEITQTVVATGILTIPLIAALPGLQVYINGLGQTDYSYTSTLLTLPIGLNLVIGDVIKVTYFSNV